MGCETIPDLLARLGVQGTEEQRREVSQQFGGHALALILLGSYLHEVFDGDVSRAGEVSLLEEDAEQGGHARRVLRSYERWLNGDTIADQDDVAHARREEIQRHGKPMLAVLRLLGLFDRPADAGCVAALRAEPAIEGLTDTLVGLSDRQWSRLITRLRKLSLVAEAESEDRHSLDAHPLVREHFATQLQDRFANTAREAHRRLYEHLKQSAPERPDTLQDMLPLYHAVAHGCQAGLEREALHQVYMDRIQRGDEYFSTKQLGAIGAELSALSSFFELPWSKLLGNLPEDDQSEVLGEAAFNLRSMGRLAESKQLYHRDLEICIASESWRNAAAQALSLSELYLILGDISTSVRAAEQSVGLADRSDDTHHRILGRATMAAALHRSARGGESLAAFREAEVMQIEMQPQYPLLYSQRGFLYCDLLLDTGQLAVILKNDTF